MMNRESVINKVTQDYIDQYLESAKKINYTDLKEKDGLTRHLYKDLPNTLINGYPIASDYVAPDGTAYSVAEFQTIPENLKKECELRYYYLPYSHELYVGTTGSGKTTGCVEPQLRAISSQKNKPNLFLTDPKGELFDRNAKHLKDCGYETFVLNFKDLIRSDRWNPLLEIYDIKMEVLAVGKNSVLRSGKPDANLSLVGAESEFKPQYIEYKGKAFPTEKAFDGYLQFEKDFLEARIDNELNQLANMMVKVQSSTDKSWEFGAQDLLKGLLQCMLEDAANPKSGFRRDMMTFRTLQMYYLAIKKEIFSDRGVTLGNHWLTKDKSEKTRALMATALGNAPNTMRSYCGVFDGAIKDWFQGHIFALTTNNTIDLSQESGKPFAVFLITRDYEKSDFLIAGLFIDWVYRQMIEHAENTKNSRAVHFLLDEFGNIPEIRDLENKISTARSRNIWFHLVVQSYKQIDVVYGADRSVIIRDNCNSQIFLGAQNRNTKEIFSNECGKHSVPTLNSKLIVTDNTINEVPLIPVSALDNITPGQMYTKRLYMPVITSQFIRSYMCAENGTYKDFFNADGLKNCTPIAIESFTAPRFTYAKLVNKRNDFFAD